MLSFGSIIKIPTTERMGVISGVLNLNRKTTLIVYPISSCVYLASNEDFLCKTKISKNTIMIETWNPVLIISKQDLQSVDTICKDYIQLYEKFLYSTLLHLDFEEKRLFTGPPLNANLDVRHLFRLEERKVFELLLRPFKQVLVTTITQVTM